MSPREPAPGMGDFLKSWMQYPLPQHTLSRILHGLARSRHAWMRDHVLPWFAERYQLDLKEAERSELDDYESLDDLFTRRLRAGARPVDHEAGLVSPVDGIISQLGAIEEDAIFQAKARYYGLEDLLQDDPDWRDFTNGRFATLYLAPHHYHRVHMPIDGTLTRLMHVPGRLFSVNPATVRGVDRLFARNERIIARFDTEFGPMAVVLVGALLVGSIETVWTGEITPPTRLRARTMALPSAGRERHLQRGAELGCFHMGSTVIVLTNPDAPNFRPAHAPGTEIRVGQGLTNPPEPRKEGTSNV